MIKGNKKTVKKIIASILVIGVILILTEFIKVKDYEYMVCENGKVSIEQYNGDDAVVRIPSTIWGKDVYMIESNVFKGNETIQEVYIPDTITLINSAFDRAINLRKITGAENLETIGHVAFANCEKLESIPDFSNVKTIYAGAFKRCSSLKSIVLPEGLENIGDGAFVSAKNLCEVKIPDSVKSIGDNAFENTPWYEKVPINTVVGDGILLKADKSQENMFIEKGIKKIYSTNIEEADNTRNIYIPNTVERIESITIYTNEDIKIYIPSSVTGGYIYIFADEPNVTLYVEENSYAHEYALRYAEENGFNYEIVDDVQAIYESTLAESQSK